MLYALASAFIGNAGYAPVLIFLNERFPTALRASGTGLSWNIGFALGGMMPTFVSLASRPPPAIPMSLANFSGAVYVIYLVGASSSPRPRASSPEGGRSPRATGLARAAASSDRCSFRGRQ